MKILLVLILVFYCELDVLSQPEFKVAVDYFEWKYPTGNKVTLEVNLKISNIGNVQGSCEDIKNIELYSKDDFYKNDIELRERGTNIFMQIKAGDNIFSFLNFEVPKAAGGLYLKLNDGFGSNEKFITDSYNNYLLEQAEYYYYNKQYSDAIEKYQICIKNDPLQKNVISLKIADCYEYIGNKLLDDYYLYNINENLEKSLDNFKQSLFYDTKKPFIKDKIATIYDILGDSYAVSLNYSKAVNSYKLSLDYSYSSTVNGKLEKVNKQTINKKDEKKETSKKKPQKSGKSKSKKPKRSQSK